jgi:NADH-quinone oxidoreductase subunit H
MQTQGITKNIYIWNDLSFIIIIQSVLKILLIIVPLLIAVAYFTLFERKVISSMQRRRGPNVVGFFGLLQPLADGLKLLLKETVLPTSANLAMFVTAPIITFMLSLIGWAVMPFDETMVFADINLSILYIFAVSSLGVYGVLISGWASNSKYAFLGALRSAAQMVSYEVSIGFILINVILCAGSLNLTDIVLAQKNVWYIIPLFPLFIMFFISALAETNRHPFDLPEAEAELVAGYYVEYSAMGFALFFLGESANILFMCSLTTVLFLGGWYAPLDVFFFNFIPGFIWFGIKTVLVLFLFIWVRVAFPRYRYDQLMRLGWKIFLPLSLAFLITTGGLLLYFNILPLS